jgi:Skp family chaperone for outer membrane proteins
VKIAIIDVVKVLDETKQGVAGAKQLETLFNEQQRELAPLLQQARAKKPPDPKLHKQLEDQMKTHEAAREKMRVELREALLAKVRPMMEKVATEQGFDFVLARPQAMMFVRPELDITASVVAALDALS